MTATAKEPERIRVHTLGGLRIERKGKTLAELPGQPVRCALLLYLAWERGATRDEVLGILWPDRDQERARASLSQTLYELRRALGDGWYEASADRIEATSALSLDALDFVEAVEGGRHAEALALYAGPFLRGTHLGAGRAFEDWVDARRVRLERRLRAAARAEADAYEASGDLPQALDVLERWADLDPLDDEAHQRLIRVLAATGHRSEALVRYERYRELLERELQVEPLDETKALVESLRAPEPEGGAAASEAASAAETGVASAADAGGGSPAEAAVASAADAGLPASTAARVGGTALLLGALGLAGAFLSGALLLPGGSGSGGSPGASLAADGFSPFEGVAVLPFANLSDDPDHEYFSDGITEDLISHLARIEGLRVPSRTSVMRYKEREASVGEIAHELGVSHLLAGSVRRDGDRVRITAQLVDAARDDHLWAETFDRELTDVFRIQSEIAELVAGALRRRLSPAERGRIADGGTESLDAYDLLLRGREYLNRPGEADVRKYPPAMAFFREALEVDPDYAPAFVGLSRAFQEHVGLPFDVRRDSALVYATRAVEADADLPEAAAAMGWGLLTSGEPQAAGTWFRRALELEAAQPDAVEGLARMAWLEGRLDEAVRWQRRAVAVDPFSPPRLSVLGSFLLDLGDLEGAAEVYRRSMELAPDAPAPAFALAQIRLVQGRDDEAEAIIERLGAAASDHPGTRFLTGRFEAQRGRHEAAAAHLEQAAGALGDIATLLLHRAHVARALGDEAEAERLLAAAEADIVRWEAEGFEAPRLRLQLHALRGEVDAAAATLRASWRNDRLAGPQFGTYWLDRDPLLSRVAGEEPFARALGGIRAELDSMRAVPAEG
jgi:TolB-like protein/DNA-binding SARP family transcriptional activator/Tfp pilus assembly protein PilF